MVEEDVWREVEDEEEDEVSKRLFVLSEPCFVFLVLHVYILLLLLIFLLFLLFLSF